MIRQLSIRNYALIESLEMTPSAHLNMVTGETGAGKSIMLGAIGLLLGKRADTKALLHSDEKCIIEATFDISQLGLSSIFETLDLDYDDHTIIRREITPSGKSRAFVNDTPVVLDTLKELAAPLVDIHSQHETLQLQKSQFQLQFIDSIAQTSELLQEYKRCFAQFVSCKHELEQLQSAAAEAQKDFDYNKFLLNELHEAGIIDHELAHAEEALEILENAEEIKSKLHEAAVTLADGEISINDMLYEATSSIAKLSGFGDTYSDVHRRLESCLLELTDIHREIAHLTESVEFDPEQTITLRQRIDLINGLLQKHQVKTIDELLHIQEELEQRVRKTDDYDKQIATCQAQLQQLEQDLMTQASSLSEKRCGVFGTAEKELTSLLADLGMPDAELRIEQHQTEPTTTGIDRIQFMFSANKGIPVADIKQVASGGEFSRLVFALKYLMAKNSALPTLIFDEIDTGISGEIALKMAALMRQMANKHQLITITHLPQMAGQGDRHFFVYKDNSDDRTVSKVRELNPEERIANIAEMIGGKKPSDSAFQSARELLSDHI